MPETPRQAARAELDALLAERRVYVTAATDAWLAYNKAKAKLEEHDLLIGLASEASVDLDWSPDRVDPDAAGEQHV